ncbi:carbon-nitrogen hydrolase family protein [Actibacterium sp. 188UL27-1]|uniref:carbon-nitrogen hydrolase family protein n=1 Tax=Actibacterium sp. 188UL27-1 TaxID=2786961 RepID=UPI00195B869B|nr:carbon-nitrogen hydrolase family protein [Actibacterium sp. 188UL27-1]MBM7067293.1 carbon-nitrogen hydrolase family protein [Actibacterium sp. 188UL27-1]
MRAALLQLNSSDDPAVNLPATLDLVDQAVAGGARFVLTPEVTNCVSPSRARQMAVLQVEDKDPTLAALSKAARHHGVWILIGSLAVKTDSTGGRFANRSFLISDAGQIVARYDKIHMFDVTISDSETYRESAGYKPGERAVLAQTPLGTVGMTICYDLRFPHLYRSLAQAGAQILTVPSAFSPVSGAAHWEPLLRARAIETGCYVLAPAQCGTHAASEGKVRKTHGHSLAIAPWGEVIADGGTDPGCVFVDLDLAEIEAARSRIPSVTTNPAFDGPV